MDGPKDKSTIALEARTRAADKLYSPSAARNAAPIRDVLAPLLGDGARVLEIGSGTGEHAEAVCLARPDVTWIPSDPDAASRASATARSLEIPGMEPALAIDVSVPQWTEHLDFVDAVVCSNVIHIAPWSVAEGLAAGAEALISGDGLLFLYGPFLFGEASAPSNLAFDEDLRTRNPQWGVRPLDAVTKLMARHRFALHEKIEMPANNLSLVFRPEPQ
jgi:hypothetical protein